MFVICVLTAGKNHLKFIQEISKFWLCNRYWWNCGFYIFYCIFRWAKSYCPRYNVYWDSTHIKWSLHSDSFLSKSLPVYTIFSIQQNHHTPRTDVCWGVRWRIDVLAVLAVSLMVLIAGAVAIMLALAKMVYRILRNGNL